MATELKEAKVTVRISTDEALKELDRLDTETKERKEQRDADAKKGREERGRPDEAQADDARSGEDRNAGPRATNASGRSAAGGSGTSGAPLSSWADVRSRARDFSEGPGTAVKSLATESIRAVPVFGPIAVAGARFGQFGAEYGPAALAAIRPFVPEELREEFDRAADAARTGSRAILGLNAKIRSVDTTAEQLKAMAVTQSLWGVPVRPEAMAAAGARLYRVNYAQDMLRRTREAIAREAGGTAIGNLTAEVVREAFAGGSR